MSGFADGTPFSPNQLARPSVPAHAMSITISSSGSADSMQRTPKPYVHLSINSVDLVVFDPQGGYDADRFDRYASFVEARDAALTCIEAMLDEADYEDEAHRSELETMQVLFEAANGFEDLMAQPGYRWFLGRLEPAVSVAA